MDEFPPTANLTDLDRNNIQNGCFLNLRFIWAVHRQAGGDRGALAPAGIGRHLPPALAGIGCRQWRETDGARFT
jgi:hypothetical protein